MKTIRKYNRGVGVLSLLVILAGVIIVVMAVKPASVCEQTLAYDVGSINPKFNITKEEIVGLLGGAENIWEEGMGMNLFQYQPDADFKINLVFDERQRKTIAERRAREFLEKGGNSYEAVTKKYKSLLSLHKAGLKQYNERVASYEERLNKYNKKVAYYNSKGGASKEKYKELENTRIGFKSEVAGLNKTLKELNTLNSRVNTLAKEINKVAGTYNTKVAQYNNVFGASVTFDQGEYTGSEINVYQFDKKSDLRLVLTHEFGHALNLDHVENPTSVMYYLMGKQDLNNPKLSSEDIFALKTECGIK